MDRKKIKQLIQTSNYNDAWKHLIDEAQNTVEFPDFSALCRLHKLLLQQGGPCPNHQKIKVAVLGGATTDMLEAPFVLALASINLDCTLHVAPYNTFAQEILDPNSATVIFRPDVCWLINTTANISAWPETGTDVTQAEKLATETCQYWIDLSTRLYATCQCEIIINNFPAIPLNPLTNLGSKLPWDKNNFIRRLNQKLGDAAQPYVHINDIFSLSAYYGLTTWHDYRYWYHAKQPVSFDCLVPYVRNSARILGALYGRTAKCLVLDLDNTLWGGVVGDDGVHGLAIGEGNAVGEAFKGFQEYILQLKERGILLAVCSKNEEANALAPFEQLPEMVLKREDFVAFKANWQPKPDNIREIAQELNIGLNSLVFVDDNPFERELVRATLPEVHVIELGDDPAEYPSLVDRAGLFEITALSTEDHERSRQYLENAERTQLQQSSTDYKGYLESLNQTATICPFDDIYLDRITQLINKTNQFNLTTLRQTRSQVEALMQDPNVIALYVQLSDRFGNNGLIAVWFAEREDTDLYIRQWLMSCRVLKRLVEQLLLNVVVEKARQLRINRIHGSYIPTAKNKLVKNHYRDLGFVNAKTEANGTTHWHLDIKNFSPFDTPIELTD